MTVPVFSDDFNSTVGFLEDQGRVRSKDVQEGKPGEDGAASPEEKPRARIDLTFVEDSNSVNIGLMVATAAPICLRVGPWSDSGDRILWCLPSRRQDFLTSAAPYPRIFCLHPVALRILGPRRYCYLALLLSGVLC